MEQNNQIIQLRLEDIVPNRYQPRINFKEEELNDLALSIKEYGIIQPLVVRPLANKYELISGERRYRAANLVGLKTVPAIVSKVGDQTSAELAMIENIQRQDLNAIEEAKSYKRLLDLGNMTQEQLAEKMGKKQTTISNKLRLLNLPDEVQQAVLENKISERHARSLLQLPTKKLQLEILEKIISERLPVKATELLIKEKLATTPASNYSTKESQTDSDIDINKLNNPTISKNNLFELTGDDKMNEQNYNDLMQQPAKPIPETPIPTPQAPTTKENNSIFGNNFFPSLDDEKTNMNLNPWTNSTPTTPAASPNPTSPINQVSPETQGVSEQPLNPWMAPTGSSTPVPPTSVPSEPVAPVPGNSLSNGNMPKMEEATTMWNNQTSEPSSPSAPLNTWEQQSPTPNQPSYNFPGQAPTSEQPVNPWMVPNEPQQSVEHPQPTSTPNNWQFNPINTPNLTPPQAPTPETNPWNNTNNLASGPLPGFIEQPLPEPFSPLPQNPVSTPMPSVSNVNVNANATPQPTNIVMPEPPKYNINDAINIIRTAIADVEKSGHKIQSSEIDMDTEYQIIIKLPKSN